MVSYPRGTSDTRRIRRLKPPQELQVETDPRGVPVRLRPAHAWLDVHLVRRPWRIDQHWWRSDQISRMYFRVAPEDGAPLTVYYDLVNKRWFRQEYA